jgi:glycosyltransferase involved in cell wall biosynthesis
MKLVLFISPHYNKCGETYIFKNFFTNYEKRKNIEFKIFNYYSEFSHIKKKNIIENPIKINFVFRFLEQKISWTYYRIWMILVFLHLQIVLPLVIIKQRKIYSEIVIISRMSNIAVSFVSLYFSYSKNIKFYCSIAGLVYKNFFRKLIWRNIMKNFEGIIIPSEDMIEHIKEYTNSTSIFTIPNPVITSRMKENKKQNFKYNKKNDFKLIAIGRLSHQKGFDTLITSIKNIPNITLDIIGGGEDYKKLILLVKKFNLGNKVKFLGWREEPWKFLKNYNLFVMPSRWEGPGHTVIEALAQNIPVIVSNCNFGPKDTIQYGKFGTLFKTNNYFDLNTKIKRVISNYRVYHKKAIKGGVTVRVKYSTKPIIKKYINLIQNKKK